MSASTTHNEMMLLSVCLVGFIQQVNEVATCFLLPGTCRVGKGITLQLCTCHNGLFFFVERKFAFILVVMVLVTDTESPNAPVACYYKGTFKIVDNVDHK